MPNMQVNEEEHDDDNEIDEISEDDELPVSEKDNRSRYFFAVMCFLVALILLSFYLNNHLDFGPGLVLLFLGIMIAYVGILFLQRRSALNVKVSSWLDNENEAGHRDLVESRETEEVQKDGEEDVQIAFEQLVEEALALIPGEFHEQMKNVLVRVESEPGEDVLRRVGVKEGYTLLGLYEGVPLTAYGRIGGPEIITIYQNTIEKYCHWDPDRIREQVRHTVLHEVAHHFGIDHDEMPIWVR